MCLKNKTQAQFPNQASPSSNTLDENASNHSGHRAAYATSVEGGAEFTEEEASFYLNRSDVHVDFIPVQAKWISTPAHPRRRHLRVLPSATEIAQVGAKTNQ